VYCLMRKTRCTMSVALGVFGVPTTSQPFVAESIRRAFVGGDMPTFRTCYFNRQHELCPLSTVPFLRLAISSDSLPIFYTPIHAIITSCQHGEWRINQKRHHIWTAGVI
jgi:hypothetical protein